MMLQLIYPLALVLVCALALLAILHPGFDDNLLQRFGLAGICFGTALQAFTLLNGQALDAPRDAAMYGLLVYGAGTLWGYLRGRKRRHDRRTSRVPKDCPYWED